MNGGTTEVMSEANRYYVYRLIDPRTGWPFYIGKGTGDRTWQHLTAETEVVTELLAGEAERVVDADLQEALEDGGRETASGGRPDVSAVRQRVREIRDDGGEPGVEWLIKKDGKDMSEAMALAVEAALIDTLRSLPIDAEHKIVNKVGGHKYAFGAHASLRAAAGARRVEVPEDRNFIVVASKGVWGGTDSTGQFAGATRQVAWDNAREAWPMARRPFRYVNEAAATDSPVILLGLARDPLKRFSNVIVCVEEISAVSTITSDDPTRPQFARGKRFARPEHELASTTELRDALLGNAPYVGDRQLRPNMLLVYHGPWRSDVVG